MKRPRLRAVHKNIRSRRVELDLSQEELGRRVGAHKTVVSHWECGASSPRNVMLPAVAEALETTVDALLSDRGAA